MYSFYVIHGRRTVYLMFLLCVVALSFWFVFQPGAPKPASSNLTSWQQYAPDSTAEDLNEPAVLVLSGSEPRVVDELESSTEVVTVTAIPAKFSEYRMERERVRSRQLEILETVVNDSSANEQRRQQAQSDLIALIGLMAKETEIENLLRAKGYIDAITILMENAATVVVPVTLAMAEATQIGELVNRITGVRLERITIVDELTKS